MSRRMINSDEHVEVVMADFNAPLSIHLERPNKYSERESRQLGRWHVGAFQRYVITDSLQNQRCTTRYLYHMYDSL
jgi:hypothetical protein